MHDSKILRAYIRESISQINENPLLIYSLLGQKHAEQFKDDYAEAERQKHPGKTEVVPGSLFSFTYHGNPNVVVVAVNESQNLVVYRRYSKSSLTNSSTRQPLNGKEIDPNLPWIRDAISAKNGWKSNQELAALLYNAYDEYVRNFEEIVNPVSGIKKDSIDLDEFFYANIDTSKLFWPTPLASTRGKESVEYFTCGLTTTEAIDIVIKQKPTTDEWYMAAACFFEYANGLESLVFCAAAGASIGFLSTIAPAAAGTAGTGGAAAPVAGASVGGATLVGAGIGAALCDVVLRIPVMIWAAYNDEDDFLAANLAYSIIVAVFETLSFFKLLPSSAKFTVLNIASQVVTSFITQFTAPSSGADTLLQKVNEYLGSPFNVQSVVDESTERLMQKIKENYPTY